MFFKLFKRFENNKKIFNSKNPIFVLSIYIKYIFENFQYKRTKPKII